MLNFYFDKINFVKCLVFCGEKKKKTAFSLKFVESSPSPSWKILIFRYQLYSLSVINLCIHKMFISKHCVDKNLLIGISGWLTVRRTQERRVKSVYSFGGNIALGFAYGRLRCSAGRTFPRFAAAAASDGRKDPLFHIRTCK